MSNKAKFSQVIIPIALCISLQLYYKVSLIYVKSNLYFYHVFAVKSRCYGRCYVRKLVPLCTFLKFHAHLEVNSARLFQNVFSKCSRVLNLVFSKKWNFPEHRHILRRVPP